ncbi:hypothetical protein BN14_06627 [Rhizoctonia solani AG-1 IB]|uniref:Uncharacterized protein n=1 Tax=Thanatephorus cucumeris (strain AG1-IB / isolate 7/3/14) TaxID=1108050 RepID=M5C0T2_THACB|nr:hypothetical protein BN14_06627 [Rhizoctonia solani AG-1 IB]
MGLASSFSLPMSLLRQALRSRASRSNLQDAEGSSSPPSKKSYAKSIKSVASVKTLAASLTSFYTKTVGPSGAAGIPKQRWSPRSELGKPAFPSKSPELRLVDGVESCNDDIVSGVGTVRTQDERLVFPAFLQQLPEFVSIAAFNGYIIFGLVWVFLLAASTNTARSLLP